MEFDVYDMLVFEDKSCSIYQDCICSVSKEVSNEGKNYTFISCSLFGIEQYEDDLVICKRDGINSPWYYDTNIKLKEIWTRTDEDTYKKVWENK